MGTTVDSLIETAISDASTAISDAMEDEMEKLRKIQDAAECLWQSIKDDDDGNMVASSSELEDFDSAMKSA